MTGIYKKDSTYTGLNLCPLYSMGVTLISPKGRTLRMALQRMQTCFRCETLVPIRE
jgi:hypothetical protein